MAEWLFTEIFHLAVGTPRQWRRRVISRFEPAKSFLADKSNRVKDAHQNQQCQKSESEKKFRGDQLPDKVELQEKNCGNSNREALAKFCLDRKSVV